MHTQPFATGFPVGRSGAMHAPRTVLIIAGLPYTAAGYRLSAAAYCTLRCSYRYTFLPDW